VTSRERLIAAARGGEVDRRPVICWPGELASPSDAIVSDLSNFDGALRANGGNPRPDVSSESPVLLVEVSNPFGRALESGIDLNALLADNPEEGGKVLDGLVSQTREDMISAYDGDADGVVYLLHGACEKHCSPMQYGGHYLERDRELLDWASDAALNMLFVVGDRDLYLDFVSDLPAQLFGWDNRTSGISAADGRALRGGAVATFDPGSDVLLTTSGSSAAQILEKTRRESAV
jgi:hypothetical protein